MTDPSALDELKKAVIAQKKVIFPFEAEDPELAELHQALRALDALVSTVVIQALQHSPSTVPAGEIDRAQAQVQTLLDRGELSPNRHVAFYRSYFLRLMDLLQIARRSETGSH